MLIDVAATTSDLETFLALFRVAPLTVSAIFLGGFGLIAVAIWLVLDWFYKGRLETKNATIEKKDGEISILERRVELAEADVRRETARPDKDAEVRAKAELVREWDESLRGLFGQMVRHGSVTISLRPTDSSSAQALANVQYLLSQDLGNVVVSPDAAHLTIQSSAASTAVASLLGIAKVDVDDEKVFVIKATESNPQSSR